MLNTNHNEVDQWIEEISYICRKYDFENGDYPESRYEGLNVFRFILEYCDFDSDIVKDLLNIWEDAKDIDEFSLNKTWSNK